MDDIRIRLQRASRLVAVPDRAFDRLLDRRDRARRKQRLAAFIVAVVVGAGSVGGVGILLSRIGQSPEDAIGAGWQPDRDLSLGANDYFYLSIRSSDLGDGQVRDEETWWRVDGSGEVRNGGTRQDKYPYPPTGRYGAGGFPIWYDVSSLSTDPSVLAAQLRREAEERFGDPTPEALWDASGLILFETPYAIPELRAAVFEVASDIEGVTLTEDARDPAGRPAVGLGFSDTENGATWTMYFDHGTHQAMAWTFRSDRGGEGWQVLGSGIVDAVGARPTGQQWLVPPIPTDTA